MNVFQYSALEEKKFEAMASEVGYQRKTTFYADLSIAEWYGEKSIRDTYNNVVKSWGDNTEYFTEFIMCLNWKIWEFYEKNEPIARVYNELWENACQYVEDNWKDEQLQYYYTTTD